MTIPHISQTSQLISKKEEIFLVSRDEKPDTGTILRLIGRTQIHLTSLPSNFDAIKSVLQPHEHWNLLAYVVETFKRRVWCIAFQTSFWIKVLELACFVNSIMMRVWLKNSACTYLHRSKTICLSNTTRLNRLIEIQNLYFSFISKKLEPTRCWLTPSWFIQVARYYCRTSDTTHKICQNIHFRTQGEIPCRTWLEFDSNNAFSSYKYQT